MKHVRIMKIISYKKKSSNLYEIALSDKRVFSLYKSLFLKNKKAEFSWSVNDVDFYDRLIGDVSENGIFEGYQFYQLGCELFGIKRYEGKARKNPAKHREILENFNKKRGRPKPSSYKSL